MERKTDLVRLDSKIKARLERIAKKNRRTLAAELAIAAEAHIKMSKLLSERNPH